ncbi:MAG: hypothetical protein JWO62_3699 [Acidimicrobiaceae bacterium]|jgi:chaperone modulatory protein CbpM|nr:hypothetical protein [Acidimicrobiaceae bacterium]
MTTTALAHPTLLSLETVARCSGLHPDQILRLVALGVLDPQAGPYGQPWFRPDQLAVIARLQRLRAGLGLDYVAAGVVSDLLARIDRLEMALRAALPDR